MADDAPAAEIPPGPAPGVVDEHAAVNIKRARERLGLSQADLAEKMAAIGWRFHPQTVHRIEAGQRKVFIGEAEALARILQTTVDRLGWAQGEDAEVAMTDMAITRIRQAWHEVSDATLRLAAALAAGHRQAEAAKASRHKRVRAVASELAAEAAESTVESAVGDGLARFEEGDA